MHLGLARTALLGWLRARSVGGTFVLRIEDLDGPRVVPGASEQLLRDLQYLGLDWDEGPDVGGAFGPYIQSQRGDRYRDALADLRARGRVYPCSCTRRELALASAPHGPTEFGPAYPGLCRNGARHPDAPTSLRFRCPDQLPMFLDGLLGEVAPLAQGDFVVLRADGQVSYQLAVVLDDIAMEISEVLRGDDLAGCTAWQIALYEVLGATAPNYVHVPLLRGPDGKRLAKRSGARSIAELRDAGVSAERIISALAASVGLLELGARRGAAELLADFSLARIRETPIDWERALGPSR
ncbi:MAG: glutamyl-Q-tRNA synthetase [Myxococcaceae bacterium]|nr:glutamyl-Q-tRNA synthetase [Myxococcaceae bacterium]